MKLNLGCGDRKMKGYVNVDKFCDPDVRVDLFKFPWLWDTNSIDEVYSDNFFEHVQEFTRSWREVHRILKPGGRFTLIVPHFRNAMFQWPEQHRQQFAIGTFKYCLMRDDECYGGKHLFDTIRLRHWYGRKMKFFTPFANIHPLTWDWLGLPVGWIEWTGVKI